MRNTTNIILDMGHPIMLCYKYLHMKRQSGTTILLSCIYTFLIKSHPRAAAMKIKRAHSRSHKIIKIYTGHSILPQMAENYC